MKEEHREDAKRIGRNILNLIIKNEIEQKDLAKALGVSESTVSSWVNGTRIPRMGTISKICNYFDVPKSAVLGDGYTFRVSDTHLPMPKSAEEDFKRKVLEIMEEQKKQQEQEYYDNEVVQAVTDRLRTNPEYGVLFKASANVRPEDIELVTKFIEKMS